MYLCIQGQKVKGQLARRVDLGAKARASENEREMHRGRASEIFFSLRLKRKISSVLK